MRLFYANVIEKWLPFSKITHLLASTEFFESRRPNDDAKNIVDFGNLSKSHAACCDVVS